MHFKFIGPTLRFNLVAEILQLSFGPWGKKKNFGQLFLRSAAGNLFFDCLRLQNLKMVRELILRFLAVLKSSLSPYEKAKC